MSQVYHRSALVISAIANRRYVKVWLKVWVRVRMRVRMRVKV